LSDSCSSESGGAVDDSVDETPVDDIEQALAKALSEASTAARWDVVAQLAKELEARRLARAGNVVSLKARRGQ
jgi:hypothetical protein